MAWRPHGSFTVDPDNPRALATCDRCGRQTNLYKLSWQLQWCGPKLQNLRLLVCDQGCLDAPAPFLRPPILSPDPADVLNTRARVEPLGIDFTDFRVTTTPEIRETEAPTEQPRITENDTET